MRLIYQCNEQHDPERPFKLRAACPACQTNLVMLNGEVHYDESRLQMGSCHADVVLNTSRFARPAKPLPVPVPISILRRQRETVER
jgi:hypothetical protein